MYGFFHAGYEKNQAGMSLHRVGEPLIKPRHRAARKSAFQKRIRVGMYSVGDSLPEDRLPGRPMPRRWDRARRLHELRGILFAGMKDTRSGPVTWLVLLLIHGICLDALCLKIFTDRLQDSSLLWIFLLPKW